MFGKMNRKSAKIRKFDETGLFRSQIEKALDIISKAASESSF